jgi:hypothetical protein
MTVVDGSDNTASKSKRNIVIRGNVADFTKNSNNKVYFAYFTGVGSRLVNADISDNFIRHNSNGISQVIVVEGGDDPSRSNVAVKITRNFIENTNATRAGTAIIVRNLQYSMITDNVVTGFDDGIVAGETNGGSSFDVLVTGNHFTLDSSGTAISIESGVDGLKVYGNTQIGASQLYGGTGAPVNGISAKELVTFARFSNTVTGGSFFAADCGAGGTAIAGSAECPGQLVAMCSSTSTSQCPNGSSVFPGRYWLAKCSSSGTPVATATCLPK